ncbi:UNVERIFIED_CONTAM: putative fatty acyl-CoA reductase 4 [Sesamum latifolium]|uniref:Fatty acyl-CoA reductase n=1 Tax=Sesamum latifolium TaxID=2727402 RepID=A0AAW2Y2W0_9LAMI
MPIHMGETLPGAKVSYVDINTEKAIVEQKLRELEALNASQKEITFCHEDLGFQRATLHGWPNTYVFTKAMGEMLLEETKENDYNVIVIRPTIITSTYREPFPDWIEGLRTLDALFAAYGKAKPTIFIGDPQSAIDIVPGDMVVNSMLAAVARHSNQPSHDLTIYHVGSSRRNPIYYKDVQSLMYKYLLEKPFLDDRGSLSSFDDANTEGLRVATRQQNSDVDDMFGFDPKCIHWEEYLMNTHFPGIVKYSLK